MKIEGGQSKQKFIHVYLKEEIKRERKRENTLYVRRNF